MNFKRILVLLICLSMTLGTFIACAEKDDGPTTDGTEFEAPSDGVPEDFDLDGETVGIFYASHCELETIGIEDSQDIVYTKIYERNMKVEGRLNCKLEFIPSGTTYWGDVSGVLNTSVTRLDDSFSIVITTNNTVIQNKLFHLFYDLNESPYIDIDSEWYYKYAIEECSVDGYYYRFLYGDATLSSLGNNGAIYYNKRLYSEYVDPGNPDGLYELVLNGTWTLEKLDIAIRDSYIDRGGENDIYGYTLIRYAEPLHYFPIGCGIEFYQRDASGKAIVTVNNDKAIEFTNDLYNLLYNNKGAHLYYPNMIDAEHGQPMFTDGKYIFNLASLNNMLNEEMREMDDEFGVLPYPKWENEQEEYITMNANGSVLVGCTKNVTFDYAMDVSTAVIEAMSSEGYRSITPAFYETALKRAYSRDDTTARMIDIICGRDPEIKSRVTKNFLYEYNSSLGGIGAIFANIMGQGKKGSPDFTSTYSSIAFEGLIDELWKEYLKDSME